MILTKKDFDTIGSEGIVASAGLIYKLLLHCNYEIITDINIVPTKELRLNNKMIDLVNIFDIINYLKLHHTTYKLIKRRIDELTNSKKLNKVELILECNDILDQIVDIYTAKYFYNRLPQDTIQNQLKTIRM